MNFKSRYIPYRATASFSNIVYDYLDNDPQLKDFYQYNPDIDGIKKAIDDRKHHPYHRNILVEELQKQYATVETNEKIKSNINSLLNENSFTICTAHQPNIFTGHLYFIYKILHAIKLADELNETLSGYHFVPVYYMGTEDADLQELGEVMINGKKYEWKTDQKGAVGRMKIDKPFITLIEEINGQLSVEKYGSEIINLIKNCYTPGKTVEQATFELVNDLFKEMGLLILLPDNAMLKSEFSEIVSKELDSGFSQKLVAETVKTFPALYKVQAAGRDINLFYLKDDIRERIEWIDDKYAITNTSIAFTRQEMLAEIKAYPERFSPNVILRPVFQEMILPNIVFVGGGGELAYWLELKKVFDSVNIPYPVLILRNSFMIVNKKLSEKILKLQFDITAFFKTENELLTSLVKRDTKLSLTLGDEKKLLAALYNQISITAKVIDATLEEHVRALHHQSLKKIELLEKKMLKAEKKKFEAQQRQIHKIKEVLYPGGILQERIDNLLPYYALYGKEFINMVYENSKGSDMQFCIVENI